jgi:hypothetical protein
MFLNTASLQLFQKVLHCFPCEFYGGLKDFVSTAVNPNVFQAVLVRVHDRVWVAGICNILFKVWESNRAEQDTYISEIPVYGCV